MPRLPSLTPERVTNSRALYFNIGSDFVSNNYLDLGLFLTNIVLVEIFIFIVGRNGFNLAKIKAFMVKERLEIYWGMLLSNMVRLILPWRSVIQGGASNYASKMNLAVFYLLYMVLIFLVAVSFVS
jgi:hypothetical protein